MMSTSEITISQPQKRLGSIPRLALMVFCLLSIGISARQTLWYFSLSPSYSDFRIFMTGVALVDAGHGHELYQFRAQRIAQEAMYPDTRHNGLLPFNHLAFELLLYWPVALLPYHVAIAAWALLNLLLVFVIGWLLDPYTQAIKHATGIPIAMFLLAFYPVIYVFAEGQDSLIFLLLVVLSLRAMDADRPFVAGLLLAAGCFKLHLALLMGFFVLLLGRKWKGVAGFATGGALATAISFLMVGRTLFTDYPAMLRQQEVMTPWGFIPWFMPNLRGVLRWTLGRWLDPGQILPFVFMASVIVGVVATWLVIRARVPKDSGLLYSISALTTILISYHLHVQDLALAALPMLLVVDWAMRHPISNRFLTAWIVLLSISVGGLYLYRLAAEPFFILLFRSCYLVIPVFLLWIVAFRAFCENRLLSSQPA